VSKWTRELLLLGKVEIGKEKSSKELDDIYKKKISISAIEYYGKDIIYFYEFEPTEEYKNMNKHLFTNNRKSYEFGVTSDIETRESGHRNDKKKENIRLDKVFQFKNRFKASRIEGYVKKIVQEMGLKLDYYTKKECLIANEEELKEIYKHIEPLTLENEIKKENEIKEKEEKEMKEKEEKEKERLENVKVKDKNDIFILLIDKYIELLKTKVITFEQYEKLLETIKIV